MLFDLTGKIAFISGGAGLLGRKHAEAIIEHGGIAIIADCDAKATHKVSHELVQRQYHYVLTLQIKMHWKRNLRVFQGLIS